MATDKETDTIVDILRQEMKVDSGSEPEKTDTPLEDSDPEVEVEAEAAATEDEQAEEPKTVFQAPEHWSSEEKEQFSSLTPEAQSFLLEKDKQFQKGFQERAEAKSELEQAIEPYKQNLALMGVDEATAIRTLFATQARIMQDPVNGILSLAQQFGVADQLREQFSPDTDDEFVDPQIKELRSQVKNLTQALQHFQNESKTKETQSLVSQVDSFKNEKDSEGNPLHPYFDEVRPLMASLVAQGKDMEEAYNEAVWSVPAYRETHLKSLQAQEKKKQEDEDELEAARRVKRAKKASNALHQTGKESPGEAAEDELSIKDELSAAWKEAQS